MTNLYLAYGSNLNLMQMYNNCPNSICIGTANLNGYHLAYKGSNDGNGYLTIEKDDNSYVPLGVYIIDRKDESKLDMYEGYPLLYSKEYLNIDFNNKTYGALIYVMKEKYGYCLPSQRYVNICIEGYKNFGFDTSILDNAYTFSKDEKKKILLKKGIIKQ